MSFMVNKSFVIDILYIFFGVLHIFDTDFYRKFLYFDPFDTLDKLIPNWLDYYLDKIIMLS